jgi:hypothetical protein
MTDPLHIFDMDITSFTEADVPSCPGFARVAQTRIVDDCPLFHQEGCQ